MAIHLEAMATDDSISIDEIAEALDTSSHSERRDAAFSLGRSPQRALFRKARVQVGLENFVPAEVDPLVPVHHAGRNTLPLPGKHKFFEKRFCRPDDGTERLFGYNEAPSRGLVGPGYFIAHSTASNSTWRERGAIVIDYFDVPDSRVPESWPRVVPNSSGLQRFVYHHTRDFMRRVSAHVTIGAAHKEEKALDHYFILVREDPATRR